MRAAWVLILCGCAGDGSATVAGDDDDDDDAVLTEEGFRDAFEERVCAAFDDCFPGEPCDGSLPVFDDCAFDPAAAVACLDGEFFCNDEFGPGYEFVDQPLVCHDVWDCPSTTGI